MKLTEGLEKRSLIVQKSTSAGLMGGKMDHVTNKGFRVSAITYFMLTVEVLACSLANFYCQ